MAKAKPNPAKTKRGTSRAKPAPSGGKQAPLSAKQKSHLRALAHPLKPVVQVGHKGCTEAVLKQVNEQLDAHELIKLKIGQDAPVEREELIGSVEQATGAVLVQAMGRTVTFFRAREEGSAISLPK